MWGRKKDNETTPTPQSPDGSMHAGSTRPPVDPATPSLRIDPLTDDWARDLDPMRGWVASCVADNDPPLDLAVPATALAVVDALLDRGGIGPEERWKLEALGVVLGDAMATDVGIPWRLVTDEWGSVPGRHLGRDDVAYPMSMIAKRVEAGEPIDVRRLFVTVTDHMRQLIVGH